jgi:hypothetical protein
MMLKLLETLQDNFKKDMVFMIIMVFKSIRVDKVDKVILHIQF